MAVGRNTRDVQYLVEALSVYSGNPGIMRRYLTRAVCYKS